MSDIDDTSTTNVKVEKRRKKIHALGRKQLGNEPLWSSTGIETPKETEYKILSLLTWYNQHRDIKHAKKWLLEYLKESGASKIDIENVSSVPDYFFSVNQSAGWFARQKLLGAENLPQKIETKLKEIISQAKEFGSHTLNKQKSKVQKMHLARKTKAAITEQENSNDILGLLEEEVDKFLDNNCIAEQSINEIWFQKNNVTKMQCNDISNWFSKMYLDELKSALKKKDEQLVEGYSFLTRKQLKAYIEFISTINESAKRWTQHALVNDVSKKPRKPRKRKVKSPADQVKKLHYKKEDSEFGLTSISPTKIVGAEQLWTFNTKYRYLTKIVASDSFGLFVKGSTIKNFNPDESTERKLRKPAEVLTKVQSSGKVELKHIFESIKTRERKPTGRINNDVILLRAL